MHTLGIDLSVKAEHKAIIADEQGHYISPVLKFSTTPASLQRLLAQARAGSPDGQVQAVMEPTGMAWRALGPRFYIKGEECYCENNPQGEQITL